MSFEFIKKLPTPAEIREEYPMPQELRDLKQARDEEIRDVITGKSNKFLVIIGPPQITRLRSATMWAVWRK